MAMRFIRKIFASSGDLTPVSDDTELSGVVSYEEGYGTDYELEQSDPGKKNIERGRLNQILNDITGNTRLWQTQGFPEFVTAAMNGGDPFPYAKYMIVRHNGHSGVGYYVSLIDDNTTDPTNAATWGFWPVLSQSQWRTGDVKETERIDLEPGWVWRNGKTIGNAASGATGRANDDCYDLFVLYWTTRPQSILKMQNNAGVITPRGISADADWAAGCRMPVTDMRGCVSAGADNMGGASAAGRLTDGNPGGVVGNQIGAFGGVQTHTLGGSEVPPVQVTINGQPSSHDSTTNRQPPMILIDDDYVLNPQFKNFNTQGGGQAHNNVQPTIISNFMVKL